MFLSQMIRTNFQTCILASSNVVMGHYIVLNLLIFSVESAILIFLFYLNYYTFIGNFICNQSLSYII